MFATAHQLKQGLRLFRQTRVGLQFLTPSTSFGLQFASKKLAKVYNPSCTMLRRSPGSESFTVSRIVSDQNDQGADPHADIEFNDVNKVILSGRIFREPRAFQNQYSDRITTRITLVTADVYKKRDSDEQRVSRSYFDVATDQTLSPEVRAGAHVMIEGRMRKYKKNDGSYSVEVRAGNPVSLCLIESMKMHDVFLLVGPVSVLKPSSEPLEEKTAV
ncbi:hypothetical protein BJ742DRAFT_808316 [Cladochytrium replicatum]|nr:hypothetical protein BJ742DRAFT_808316 [Cladochytrium replicatum]